MFSGFGDLNSRFGNLSSLADGISNIDISNLGAQLANTLSLDALQQTGELNSTSDASLKESSENELVNHQKIDSESVDNVTLTNHNAESIESLKEQLMIERNISAQLLERNSILLTELQNAKKSLVDTPVTDEIQKNVDDSSKIPKNETESTDKDNKIEALKEKLRKCKRIIDDKDSKLKLAQEEISNQESTIKEIIEKHSDYDDIQKTCNQQLEIIKECENKILQLTIENEKLVTAFTTEKDLLNMQLKSIDFEFDKLKIQYENDIANKNETIEKLKNEVAILNDQKEKDNVILNNLIQSQADLIEKNDLKLTQLITENKLNEEKLTEEKLNILKSLDEIKNENVDLTLQLSIKNDLISKLEKDIVQAKLHDYVNNSESIDQDSLNNSQIELINQLQNKIDQVSTEYQIRISNLQQENVKLLNSLNEEKMNSESISNQYNNLLSDRNNEIIKLNDAIKSLQSLKDEEIIKQTNENNNLQILYNDSLKVIENFKKSFEENIIEKDNQINLLNEKILQLSNQYSEQHNEVINQYEDQVNQLKSTILEYQSSNLNDQSLIINEHNNQMNELRNENSKLIKQIEKLSQEMIRLHEDNESLNQFVSRLQNDLEKSFEEKNNIVKSNEIQIIQLKTNYSADKELYEKKIVELNENIKNLINFKDSLDNEIKQSNNIIEELKLKNQNLSDNITNFQQLLDEASTNYINITNQYESLLVKNNEQENIISRLNESSVEQSNIINSLENSNNDLKNKVNTLTDKLKDMMKKYADIKSKNALLEKAEEESHQLLHTKDSEIMSLKLKYENLESLSSDSRQLSLELSDKYSEIQRELGRLKTTINEKNNEIEILTNDNKSYTNKIQELIYDIQLKSKELEKLHDELNNHKILNETSNKEFNLKLIEQKKIYENDISNLQIEIQSLHSKLIGENDMMKSLEEYKKRAQSALKKANTTASNLLLEKEKLENNIKELNIINEEKDKEIINLQSINMNDNKMIKDLREELISCKNNINELQKEIVQLKEEINDMINNNKTIKSDYENQIAELNQIITKNSQIINNQEDIPIPSEVKALKKSDDSKNNSYYNLVEDNMIDIDLQDHNQTNKSEALFYINQLNCKIDELKNDLASRSLELNVTLQELQLEREAKRKLSNRVDDLMAIIDRTRKSTNHSNDYSKVPDSKVSLDSTSEFNVEYLKNCIYRYMSTSELSEKKRLVPVIATLLNLTKEEKRVIDNIIREEEIDTDDLAAIASIGTSIESFFGFGSKK